MTRQFAMKAKQYPFHYDVLIGNECREMSLESSEPMTSLEIKETLGLDIQTPIAHELTLVAA